MGSPAVSAPSPGETSRVHKSSPARRTVSVEILPSPAAPALTPPDRVHATKSRQIPRLTVSNIRLFMLHSMRALPAA